MVYIFFNITHERQIEHVNADLRAVGYVLAYSQQRMMYFVTASTVADVTTISMILMRNGVLGA